MRHWLRRQWCGLIHFTNRKCHMMCWIVSLLNNKKSNCWNSKCFISLILFCTWALKSVSLQNMTDTRTPLLLRVSDELIDKALCCRRAVMSMCWRSKDFVNGSLCMFVLFKKSQLVALESLYTIEIIYTFKYTDLYQRQCYTVLLVLVPRTRWICCFVKG